jgi:serine/threonine-protein kinase RsbW
MELGEKTPVSSTGTRTIGIRVRADYEELAVLRAVVETVALLADFGIDEVTDIRLALEEVATVLIQDAVPDSELDCVFGYSGAEVDIRVSAVVTSDSGPDRRGIGWHIVSTLTDSLTASVEPHDAALGGYRATVEFRWTGGGDQ